MGTGQCGECGAEFKPQKFASNKRYCSRACVERASWNRLRADPKRHRKAKRMQQKYRLLHLVEYRERGRLFMAERRRQLRFLEDQRWLEAQMPAFIEMA